MSVRRLAEPAVQPAAFAFNKANSAAVKQWLKKYPKGREQSAVIPLLMIAQEQEGWVTKPAIEHVADMLDMPYIRALEVATFYTQFQLKPVGTRAHVQVCGTTPCMLRGSEALMDVCRSKIHHEQFHTNQAGTLSWEEVECLGACVNAPMVMIFKDTFEDLTPERLGEIIDAFEAGKGASVTPGPQNGRIYSAPMSGLTTLKDESAVLKASRDQVAKTAAKEAKAAGASIPPSKAAKPKTYAAETNNTVKSPSPVKTSPKAEAAVSASTPRPDPVVANKAAESVEKAMKQRKHPIAIAGPAAAFKSPELLHGEPIGVVGKEVDAAPVRAPGSKPSLDDKNRPAGIEKPAAVDDLKLISGVGPKIEATLHSLGIYTFGQIAAWKKAEREWVDGYLNFKGRIERDDWVRQAKALAKGGVAEYIRVFGKKPV
ncbi:NADH-quinone oxidoreductase subunit E [Allomesorhizobium camelthorni]|uniref:NADH-quinone oxidoreductase subunit E n=1 Tax=Allomesorhizobium camelthorni TaxID=475069 RepID=A0A6G4W7D9_9HYPH|nr:NADH-quinone oxidoreductase subunit E [Mesorhizobium camelthorni]NGO50519.1 NADH-quinone oxidoreductase subunit E [Mesorhizobium camelthorni]